MGSLAAAGVFAFTNRAFVVDAFDWTSPKKAIEVPIFDPVTKARELRTPPPPVNALTVRAAQDTRDTATKGLPVQEETSGVELSGGSTILDGKVLGPGGPLANATVHIERFVGERLAFVDVATDAAGFWSVGNLPGGRYRIRAWQAPSFAQLQSDVAYVQDGEHRSVTLAVESPSGTEVYTDYSGSFYVGNAPTLTVTVEGPYVTANGLLRSGGRSGLAATLSVSGALAGGGAAVTDADGSVTWRVSCASIGTAFASVNVAGTSRSFAIPACTPVPTTTTTTTTAPTTSTPRTTTTTDGPDGTTTTTAKPAATTTTAKVS